jgi:hypothetical protein
VVPVIRFAATSDGGSAPREIAKRIILILMLISDLIGGGVITFLIQQASWTFDKVNLSRQSRSSQLNSRPPVMMSTGVLSTSVLFSLLVAGQLYLVLRLSSR